MSVAISEVVKGKAGYVAVGEVEKSAGSVQG